MKYRSIGDMPRPSGFRYQAVAEKGKPRHERFDTFYIRHPFMEMGKRAKIFAPFDALNGFSDAVSAKRERYVERVQLSESDAAELNSRLEALRELIPTARDAREKMISARLTYYTPCTDVNSEHYMTRGRYVTISGTVTELDTVFGQITVGGRTVKLRDILRIEL